METIEKQKAYAMDRLGYFLEELKKAQNPFAIEAVVYTLFRTAETVYGNMHETNSKETPR